ncbi:hypothetical protein V8D89_014641 [Ganoderma adspersum]
MDTGHRLAPPTAWDLVILVIRPAFWPPAYIMALAFRTLVRAHRVLYRTAPSDPPPRAKGLSSRRACVMGDMAAWGPVVASACPVPASCGHPVYSGGEENEVRTPDVFPMRADIIRPRERASIEASEIFQISPPATRDSSSASQLRAFNGIRVGCGSRGQVGAARTEHR